MANFEGYLFAHYSNTGVTTPFNNKFIQYGTWSSNPNQREEIKAYRDENTRNLTRITASGKKSVFSFKTRKHLHLSEKIAIQNFFKGHELSASERKIRLKFWDDENNEYKIGEFYRPNMPFPIEKITENDIIYGELEFNFVEY